MKTIIDKYSGKQVIKAGEQLAKYETLNDKMFQDAFDVLSFWRFTHEIPLERAINLLKKIASNKDKSAIFAKRLKRYISIVLKLRRFPEMKLKNMQDIGGCRAIVSNTKRVYQIVRELKRRKEFKNESEKIRYKDYIKNPKEDGYRGFHLIGKFNDNAGGDRNIEIQVRTRLQHDWATTLEIVDLFTGQALKSNQGEENWKEFFRSVSDQFSLMESIHLFDTMTDDQKLFKYQQSLLNNQIKINSFHISKDLAQKLDVVRMLQAYANSLKIVDQHLSKDLINGYVLLEVDTINATVNSILFPEAQNDIAKERYASAEKAATEKIGIVVALVSTTAVGGIKEAYPNYFADSTEFIIHLLLIVNSPRIQL